MKRKLHVIAGLLFVLSLLYDFYLWGGLARNPAVGPVVLDATQREVGLAGVYVPVGRALVGAVGAGDAAQAFAAESFGALQPRLLSNPAAAMETLLDGMSFTARANYYGAPVLLLVFLVLVWMRPRGVHMMGRR